MVDPKAGKSVAKPVEVAAAKAAAPAKAAPAAIPPAKVPPVPSASAKVAVPAKPVASVKASAVPPAATSSAGTPLIATPPAVAKPPVEAPVNIAKVVIKAVQLPLEAAKATAEVVGGPPDVAERLTDAATTVTEQAAPPIAAVDALPPPAARLAQKGMFTMPETLSPTIPTTPESFQTMLGDVSTRAKSAMETGAKMAEEIGQFAKGNVEALMTSSRVAAKGAETLGQEAASYSKKSLETATAAFKGFAAAKSPTELFKLQSDFARSSFDAAVAESSKFSEAMMKLFGEIAQPISTRVALAAEKIKTPAF